MERLELPHLYQVQKPFIRCNILKDLLKKNKFDKAKEYCISNPKVVLDILLYFIAEGNLDMFKIFFSECGYTDYNMQDNLFLKYTLSNHNIDINKRYLFLKYFLENGYNEKISECLKYIYSTNYNNGKIHVTIEILKLLMEYGADIHMDDELVFRLECFTFCNLQIIDFMVKNGTDINAYNHFAICYSVCFERYELCEYLINACANIDARNGYPLKSAIQSSFEEILELLLRAGADTKYVDCDDIIVCIDDLQMNKLVLLSQYDVDISQIINKKIENDRITEMLKYIENMGIDSKTLAILLLYNSNK